MLLKGYRTNKTTILKLVLILFINVSYQIQAQEFEKDSKSKIRILEKLIEKAENQQIDALKEKTTLITAIFF